MAKRRSSRSSRKERKVQRERSERAKERGLPGKEPTTARAPNSDEITTPSLRKRRERAASEAGHEESARAVEPTDMTWRERLAKLPQSVQLAIVAGVVLVAIFVASQFRSGPKSATPVGVPSSSQAAPVDELVGPVSSALEGAVPAAGSLDPADATPDAGIDSTVTDPQDPLPAQSPDLPAASSSTAPRPAAAPPPRPLGPTPAVARTPAAPRPPPQPVTPTPGAVPTPAPAAPQVTPAVVPAPQDNPY